LAIARVGTTTKKQKVVLCKASPQQDTTVLFLIVGVESPGLRQVFDLVRGFKGVQEAPPDLAALLSQYSSPFIDEKKKAGLRQGIKEVLLKLKTGAAPRIVVSVGPLGAVPFPIGDPFHPLHRPDLLDLLSLFQPAFEVRLLVVADDPLESLAHQLTIHPDPCKGSDSILLPLDVVDSGTCEREMVVARMVETSLVALSTQLQALSRELFTVLDYRSALRDSGAVAEPLLKFLLFEPTEHRRDLVTSTMAKLAASEAARARKLFSGHLEKRILGVLSGLRQLRWGHLLRKEFSLVRSPEAPDSYLETCYAPKMVVNKFYHTKAVNVTQEEAVLDIEA